MVLVLCCCAAGRGEDGAEEEEGGAQGRAWPRPRLASSPSRSAGSARRDEDEDDVEATEGGGREPGGVAVAWQCSVHCQTRLADAARTAAAGGAARRAGQPVCQSCFTAQRRRIAARGPPRRRRARGSPPRRAALHHADHADHAVVEEAGRRRRPRGAVRGGSDATPRPEPGSASRDPDTRPTRSAPCKLLPSRRTVIALPRPAPMMVSSASACLECVLATPAVQGRVGAPCRRHVVWWWALDPTPPRPSKRIPPARQPRRATPRHPAPLELECSLAHDVVSVEVEVLKGLLCPLGRLQGAGCGVRGAGLGAGAASAHWAASPGPRPPTPPQVRGCAGWGPAPRAPGGPWAVFPPLLSLYTPWLRLRQSYAPQPFVTLLRCSRLEGWRRASALPLPPVATPSRIPARPPLSGPNQRFISPRPAPPPLGPRLACLPACLPACLIRSSQLDAWD